MAADDCENFANRSSNDPTEDSNRAFRVISWQAVGVTNSRHFRLHILPLPLPPLLSTGRRRTKKASRVKCDWLSVFLLGQQLPSEVSECLVRIGHAVNIFTLGDGNAFPTVSGKQLIGEPTTHRTALLVATGFQNPANRQRLLSLHIDWRWGEKYFMEKLLDGDLAANNGGWQWAASTGCDPQPYFRVFNPYLQSKRFDPQGVYLKKYLPELRDLTSQSIHEPPQDLMTSGYPAPIVDHSVQRLEAIALYKGN